MIARWPQLANGTHGSLLPPSWRSLYELSRLPDEVFEEELRNAPHAMPSSPKNSPLPDPQDRRNIGAKTQRSARPNAPTPIGI
jgi:hypothetical protein